MDVFLGTLREVGDLDQVREHVVGVESQQRIAIEEQRGDTGHEDDIVGDDVGRTRGGIGPDDGSDGGDRQFKEDAGQSHHGPVPFAGEGPSAGGVHIGQREEHQKHDAHGVDLSPILVQFSECLTGKGVAEFMSDLDDNESQIEQDKIARRQDILSLGEKLFEIGPDITQARAHQQEPGQQTQPAKEQTEQGQPTIQDPIGVEQGNTDKEQIGEVTSNLAALAFLQTFKQCFAVGRQADIEEIAVVELPEYLDHFSLGGRAVAQLFVADLPGLGDAA